MQWNNITLKRDDQCSFFCRVIGEGTPLLLIHGAAVDSEFFIETAPAFAENYQVITYDRSGYGHSARENICTAESSAEYFGIQGDDAAWILEQLVPGQKAIVVGCSCGAAVAAYLAARHPELVAQVFLHEPPVYSLMPDDEGCWELIDGIHEACAQGKYNRALNRFLLFLGSSSAPSKKPMTQAEMDNFTVNGMAFIKQEVSFAFDRRFPVPVMQPGTKIAVLWGADGEGKPLVECARRVAKVLECPLHMIPGGHNEARENPEIFAQAVIQLLQGE